MARFHCPQCGIEREVPERFLGRRVRCPECGREVSIRDDAAGEFAMQASGAPKDAASRHAVPAGAVPADGVPGAAVSSGPVPADIVADAAVDAPGAVLRCAACGHETPVPARFAGRRARCPRCGEVSEITAPPASGGEPEAADVDLEDLAEDFSRSLERETAAVRSATPGEEGEGPLEDLGPDAVSPADMPALSATPGARKLLNGLVLGLVSVFFSLTLAQAPALGAGDAALFPVLLQMALAAALLGCLVYPLRSRVPFASAGPEAATCAALFLVARAAAGLPGAGASPQALTATVFVAVLGCALLSGALCFFLARFRDGEWVRFVALPVLGGVLAALGLLLIRIAWQSRTGVSPDPELLLGLLSGGAAVSFWTWLPSLFFGLLLFVLYRRVRSLWWLAAPFVLALAGGLIAGGLHPGTLPPALARELFPGAAPVMPGFLSLRSPFFLAAADWSGLSGLACLIFAVSLLLAINVAAKALVLEEHLGREVSPGPELRALGSVNLLSGVVGGFPTSLSLGRSLGALRSGGLGLPGALAAAAVCAGALVAAGPLAGLVPPFVPAGLLWFMGLNLLKRWLVDIVAEDLRAEEYGCLLLTFAVTVGVGFAPGVALGVFLALLLGLSRQSSSAALMAVLSGDAHHSNVDRATAQAEALRDIGQSILILRLQGFLSGGALSAAMRAVWERLEEPGKRPLRFVILDCTRIQSFGSGLTRVLGGLARLGREQGVRMVLTNVSFVLEARLEKTGLADGDGRGFALFRNLDYGLEWCEDRLLAEAGLLEEHTPPLAELLAPVFPDREALPQLMRILQRVEVREGDYVFRQGDVSDALFFVESGLLTVELEIPGGKTVRLKKLGPGSIFGEMGLYTHAQRSASVRANEPCVVRRLSKKRLRTLQQKLPHLATSLDSFLVTMLSGRVADANGMVRDLMR